MPTPNEQLVSEHIERQQGYVDDALALAALLIALLDESEPQVRIIIERHLRTLLDPEAQLHSPAIQGQISTMRQEILAVRTQSFSRIRERLEAELGVIVDGEWNWLVELYRRTHGMQVNRPAAEEFERLFDTPFLGRSFDEWLTDLMVKDASRISDEVIVGVLQGRTRLRILQAVLGEEDLDGNNGETQRTRNALRQIVDTGLFAMLGLAMFEFSDDNPDLPRDLYVAVLDNRTTAICRGYHGKVFARGKGPYPPLHWHCRSRRVPLPAGGEVPDVP